MSNTTMKPYPASTHEAVGRAVEYVDPMGKKHDALVTAVHGEFGVSCINVLYVSDDAREADAHGRQFKRESSVMAAGPTAAHGRYYKVV